MNTQNTIAQLQETIEEQKITISQISHEIRNPVTLIHSSLQLIEKEHPEVKEFAFWKDTMKDMQYLIHLLSELSSYNNGRILHFEKLNTTCWLQDLTRYSLTLASEEQRFTCQIPQALPALSADSTKLRQAILNLLRNAFEAAGSQGEISFTASVKDSFLTISVKDTGQGIAPDCMNTLFQPFVTCKAEGTGLGLAISKRIIEAHNGSLSFESALGKGTVFTAVLPL